MEIPRVAFTIPQFCHSHRMSRSEYYALKKRNLTPAEIRLGRKVIISGEAAERWRRRMEKLTAEGARR